MNFGYFRGEAQHSPLVTEHSPGQREEERRKHASIYGGRAAVSHKGMDGRTDDNRIIYCKLIVGEEMEPKTEFVCSCRWRRLAVLWGVKPKG